MSGNNISFITSPRVDSPSLSWRMTRLDGTVQTLKFWLRELILQYRRMPFAFLADLQRQVSHNRSVTRVCFVCSLTIYNKFASVPSSSTSISSLPAYGLQGTFSPTISSLMHTYNTAPPTDELARAQTELNQVKDIMVQNVEQILSRGERIELLVDKTDTMASQATAFRRGARSVRRQMWWKNSKILALSVLVGLVSP
jgi:vesicle-associated membrane protein 7